MGALTDDNGAFNLAVPDDATTLLISYLGYATQEVEIGGRSEIDVMLAESTSYLDEVVVIGYGTAKKSDLTGSLESINASAFEAQPIVRMDQAFTGKNSRGADHADQRFSRCRL